MPTLNKVIIDDIDDIDDSVWEGNRLQINISNSIIKSYSQTLL